MSPWVTHTPASAHPRPRGVGALGALFTLLAGCGIRLEDDAPRVPLVPTREPIPGEAALLRLLGAVRSASLAPVDPAAPLSPALAGLHRRQAEVLHDALRQRGVPQASLPSSTPTPTASGSAGVTGVLPRGSAAPVASPTPSATPVSPTGTTLVTVEGAIVAAPRCAAAEAVLRPPLGLAPRAVARRIEGAPGQVRQTCPGDDVVEPRAARPAGAGPAPGVYLLEVGASTHGKAKRTARDGIERIQHDTEVVEAAGLRPVHELG